MRPFCSKNRLFIVLFPDEGTPLLYPSIFSAISKPWW